MRHLPSFVVAASALVALPGCHPRAIQRQAVATDLQTAVQAFMSGQPLPPLTSDPKKYGIYRPLIEHFYTHVATVKALNQKIAALIPAVASSLNVDELTNPSARRLNRQNLKALIQNIEAFIRQEDELAGPGADAVAQRLVPADPEFIQQYIQGLQQGRPQVQQALDAFQAKEAYYRRIDEIIALADQSVTGMSPDRKILFTTPEALADYTAKVQELAAFAQTMNAQMRKLHGNP